MATQILLEDGPHLRKKKGGKNYSAEFDLGRPYLDVSLDETVENPPRYVVIAQLKFSRTGELKVGYWSSDYLGLEEARELYKKLRSGPVDASFKKGELNLDFGACLDL